jgi:hypothetical protein
MVLAAALHQQRANAFDNAFADVPLANPDAPRHVEVYLFSQDYPDYSRRMEAIAFVARVNMAWDMPHLTLV